jgi:hypothetical protein
VWNLVTILVILRNEYAGQLINHDYLASIPCALLIRLVVECRFFKHILATSTREVLGENLFFIQLISIAVLIAVLMPAKHWLEQ